MLPSPAAVTNAKDIFVPPVEAFVRERPTGTSRGEILQQIAFLAEHAGSTVDYPRQSEFLEIDGLE